MSDLLNGIVEWRKIGKSLSLIVALMTGLVLFLPVNLIENAGLSELREQIHPYLGASFFVSIAIFLASTLESFSSLIGSEIKDWLNHRRWSKTLHHLTDDEKAVLRRFVFDGQAAITAELNDPVVSTLVVKKILVRTANVGFPGGMSFPFTLQPWARKCLLRRRELIDAN